MYQFCRKKLNSPALFPITMQDDDLSWKLSLSYVVADDKFLLFINDIPFLALPFKADVTSAAPMTIEQGSIKLNGVRDNGVEVHNGWAQWTPDTVVGWYQENADLQPTTEIYLTRLKCSSSNMLNTLVDVLGRTIDTEQGLSKLSIYKFMDQNSLQEWPLEQLVLKSPHLESISIGDLRGTTPANRSLLVEFAAQAAIRSSCIKVLGISQTLTSAEDGDKFLQALADSSIESLTNFSISQEGAWFANDRDGCMAPLLVFLARQNSLENLYMQFN